MGMNNPHKIQKLFYLKQLVVVVCCTIQTPPDGTRLLWTADTQDTSC